LCEIRVRVSESEVLDKIIDNIDFLRFNVGQLFLWDLL
jgi:hypothetical protein